MALLSALVAATVLAQQPQVVPQRKTVLDNGVALYAEKMEKANGFSLCFVVTAFGAIEKEGQRGHRHLLEHLVAKGKDKKTDARLEAVGLYLTADTLQDGIRFEIEGSTANVNTAIEALRDLLTMRPLTPEEIAREIVIIGEESGVRSVGSNTFAALHETGFGSPDPIGTADDLAKATPASLTALHAELFQPGRMAVAVVGDVDPAAVVAGLTGVFAHLQGGLKPPRSPRTLLSPLKEGFMQGSAGSGRGVAVGSLSSPATFDVMAAAFAVASEIQGAQVMYTPSPIGGLVCVVHPARTGLDGVDAMVAGEGNRLFRAGAASVRFWAETSERAPREKARLFAQMMPAESFFRVEDFVRRSREVTQAGFLSALQKFDSRQCVRVGGVR